MFFSFGASGAQELLKTVLELVFGLARKLRWHWEANLVSYMQILFCSELSLGQDCLFSWGHTSSGWAQRIKCAGDLTQVGCVQGKQAPYVLYCFSGPGPRLVIKCYLGHLLEVQVEQELLIRNYLKFL